MGNKLPARQNGIDLFRFIAAFFIMLLHTSYGSLDPDIVANIRLLARWAVPFFFTTSGYFLATKIDTHGAIPLSRIQNNIATLITILLVSSIIYMPMLYLNGNFQLSVDDLFTGTYFHLWFIGSLLFGYISIWYFHYIGLRKLLPAVSALLIILAILFDGYDVFLKEPIDFLMYRFLLSIPFMTIGIYLSKIKMNRKAIPVLLAIALLGAIIQSVEARYLQVYYNYSSFIHEFLIGTSIIAVPLFIFSTMINVSENRFTQWGKDHSLFIYLYHPLTYYVLNVVVDKLQINFDDHMFTFPFIGFIITLSTAVFLKHFLPPLFKLMTGDISLFPKNS